MQMQLQPRPSGLPDWLYIAIVAALGLYFVIGAIAWTMFIYNGIAVPDSFTTILATIAGGLVGRRARAHRRLGPSLPGWPGGGAAGRVTVPGPQPWAWVMLTIQGMPNLSVHMPNSSPHICFSRGMVTVPPSDSFSQ